MKLRNKKTGEIRDFIINKNKIQTASAIDCWEYDSLAELNEEWEDYEEPKNNWLTKDLKKQVLLKKISELLENEEPRDIYFIDSDGNVVKSELVDGKIISLEKQAIGNYFKTKEEAEKAVEKLKAWKRLKDKGFKFKGTTTSWYDNPCIEYETNDYHNITDPEYKELQADLDLLFGGGE